MSSNSALAIAEAVDELLTEIVTKNKGVLNTEDIVSVIFTATSDLTTAFPAATARQREGWDKIALLDVQQMHVENKLKKCIRCLIQFNTEAVDADVYPVYLRKARILRPDLL